MIGSGIYDDLCTQSRLTARADGCILIIINGAGGSGFSCQASPEKTLQLPRMLRELAGNIESQIKKDLDELEGLGGK